MNVALPRIWLTQGDVAGVGPEVIVKAWPRLLGRCRPTVVGSADWTRRAARACGLSLDVVPVAGFDDSATPTRVPVLEATGADLSQVRVGTVSAAAGRAAYDFLCDAIDRTLAGEADAVVTAPLHKEGLKLAGLDFPGHTEILASRTGTDAYAMVLHGDGLTVAHVTLHTSLASVFGMLTPAAILEKIRLVRDLVPRLTGRPARIGVAALNPHAGDGGLFGDEEARIIAPAVEAARGEGIDASGPWPCDTLFVRADRGDFDGVVAMYHDQGHIAMKLRSGWRNVNITAGLPIVRTSVAHGTAYDIAGTGTADEASVIAAVEVAAKLAASRPGARTSSSASSS